MNNKPQGFEEIATPRVVKLNPATGLSILHSKTGPNAYRWQNS